MHIKNKALETVFFSIFIFTIIFSDLKDLYPLYGSNLFQDWIYILLHQTNECKHTFFFSNYENITNCEEYLSSNFVYPKIWLKISAIINNSLVFEIILLHLVLIFIFINLKILNNLKVFSKILFFFSPVTILLIERGNNDIVVFILTYLFSLFFTQKKILTSIIFMLTGILLKIYTISIIPILFLQKKNKITLLLIFLVSIILLYLTNFEYLLNNYNRSGLLLSYSSSVYFKILNTIFDLKINYQIFSILILTFIIIYSINKKINLPVSNNKDEIFFLVSSAILVSSFFLNEGFVYKLVFLSFNFPLIYEYNKINSSRFYKYILIILYLSLYVEFLPFILENIFEINREEFKNNPMISFENMLYGLSIIFKNFVFWLLNINLILISTKIFLKKFFN